MKKNYPLILLNKNETHSEIKNRDDAFHTVFQLNPLKYFLSYISIWYIYSYKVLRHASIYLWDFILYVIIMSNQSCAR